MGRQKNKLFVSALLVAALACIADRPAAGQTPDDAARMELQGIIENVTQATARRYQVHDSMGHSMDTAKIIQDPAGGYLAVYHTLINGQFVASLATSADLMNWAFQKQLGSNASQPYITALTDGGYLVAWEQTPANHLAFRYYKSRSDLLNGIASRSFDAPMTLSSCAEGTPNIYSAILAPDIDHSTIDAGAHYFSNCDVDRQQRGTLVNFSSWTTSVQTSYNNTILKFGVAGNIGDRDGAWFNRFQFGIIEGQFTKGDFGSWRSFLFDFQNGNATELSIKTDGGSTAFANPSMTNLVAPNGQSAIMTTLFLPSQGAAQGESGELVYYTTFSPNITYEAESLVAAGSTAGDVRRTALDPGYSAGQGVILEAKGAGDFMTLNVSVPQARTYDVRVGVKNLANRGIWQLSIRGVKHGPPVDQFSSSAAFQEVDLGNVTFGAAGVQPFAFSVTGKNPASSGFWIALDYVRLLPQ
jgi:hypothetical protein